MRARLGNLVLAMGLCAFVPVLATPNDVGAAPPAKKDTKEKEVPLKANPAIKEKLEKRIAPWKWGWSSDKVFGELEKQIDAQAAAKIEKLYNVKDQEKVTKDAEKKKKALRGTLVTFTGVGGPSGGLGYETKAPGEYTYKNSESAIEVPRPGGGERQLFFINDKLWKIYDHVHLTGKDAELGETWEQAVDKTTKDLDKGKLVAAKSVSPSYYGTLISVPDHVLWSDGTTQVRLVDHTKREDMTVRTVALVYEEVATLDKLSALRANVEKKQSDAQVDKAGQKDPEPVKKPKGK